MLSRVQIMPVLLQRLPKHIPLQLDAVMHATRTHAAGAAGKAHVSAA